MLYQMFDIDCGSVFSFCTKMINFTLAQFVLHDFRSFVAQDTGNDLKDGVVRILYRKIILLNVIVHEFALL